MGECWGVYQIREAYVPIQKVQWINIHIMLDPLYFWEKPEIWVFKD